MVIFPNSLSDINLNLLIGNLNINVIKIDRNIPDKNWSFEEHTHSCFEFHIINGGKGYINIESAGFCVQAGELYLTGPSVRHKQTSDAGNPMSEYCIQCYINILDSQQTDYAFSEIESKLLVETFSKCYPCIFKDVYQIDKKFELLFSEYENGKAGYFLKIQSLILDILVDLFRTIAQSDILHNKYSLPKKRADVYLIEKITGYLETNFRKNLTCKDVADYWHITPRKLNTLLKTAFNLTFHEYLITFRFNIAKKLLQTTNLSIENVAYEAGFSSHYDMYRVFKQFQAPTPASFRLQKI